MPFCLAYVPNCNDPSKFSDRQAYANSVAQIRHQSHQAVRNVYHSVCIFLAHYVEK